MGPSIIGAGIPSRAARSDAAGRQEQEGDEKGGRARLAHGSANPAGKLLGRHG